jgi:hypothetical protein
MEGQLESKHAMQNIYMKTFTTKKILNVILHNSVGAIDLLLPQFFPGDKVVRV